ncbi:isochorismatase family protein [Roseateles oligotrophus]|uniref:Isochorismatase family protein n=1 Tax=Roseateles oligotrophus TaxID=1769250 RepID=A0ABT2Y8J7_9BURK|nr:isochorismatase family protein [Roseateles oligotrophus]MCV2366622.1 isochorismatase family protein [Roseateles oligotrophus]
MKQQQALLVIDVQMDYFPDGNYPLHNAEGVLTQVEAAIHKAQAAQVPVILIQHIADPAKGPSPFFNAGSAGVATHPRVLAAAPQAPLVIKRFADSFDDTNLAQTLSELGVSELLICGMMTQNCVTHTAISKAAEQYAKVSILSDCCATVTEMLHQIALSAVSRRVTVLPLAEAF